jgi:hypothetical protein
MCDAEDFFVSDTDLPIHLDQREIDSTGQSANQAENSNYEVGL